MKKRFLNLSTNTFIVIFVLVISTIVIGSVPILNRSGERLSGMDELRQNTERLDSLMSASINEYETERL
jgi:hypothetical protein